MSRTPRWMWIVAVGCALAVLPAGLLRGFVVRAEITVGSGDEQRVLPVVLYPHRLLEYGHPLYLGALGCVGVAVAAAIWGLLRPAAWLPLVLAFTAGLAGAAQMNDGQLAESTTAPGGAFQRNAVAEAKRAVEAAYPGGGVRAGYAVDPAVGWNLTVLAFAALVVVTGFAVGRRRDLAWWLPASAVPLAVTVLQALPGENCGGNDENTADPDSHPLGQLVVNAWLALLPVGLGMLTDRGSPPARRWGLGLACVIGGPLVGFVFAVVLALMDCAFY